MANESLVMECGLFFHQGIINVSMGSSIVLVWYTTEIESSMVPNNEPGEIEVVRVYGNIDW
jgi:hypothetical protein